MLMVIKDNIPELYQFCFIWLTLKPPSWTLGRTLLCRRKGPQQGDPLGPLLFCLAVHPLLTPLLSPLNEGYLDDLTLGGPGDFVASDIRTVIARDAEIGLHLIVTKCELTRHPITTLQTSTFWKPLFKLIWKILRFWVLLFFAGWQLYLVLAQRYLDLSRAIDKLDTINSHDALILWRSSFSEPKIQHILRCSPCVNHAALTSFASHPAYLASAASKRRLQDLFLTDSCANEDSYWLDIETSWTTATGLPSPQPPSSTKLRTWDESGIQEDRAAVWSCATGDLDQARLTAVSAQYSGGWLQARPISWRGLRLDDEAIRVAVGLRLGTDLCHSHM